MKPSHGSTVRILTTEAQATRVLSRIGEVIGAQRQARVAEELGVSPQSYAAWKRRGLVPMERVLEFAMRRNVSLDWLLLNRGEARPVGRPIDVELFSRILRMLLAEIDRVVHVLREEHEGPAQMPWPYIISSACSVYERILPLRDRAARAGAADAETWKAAADFAFAHESVRRQAVEDKEGPEVAMHDGLADRLEKLGRELHDKAAGVASSAAGAQRAGTTDEAGHELPRPKRRRSGRPGRPKRS